MNLYEPFDSEQCKFLPVEVYLTRKYAFLLERMHDNEKLTIQEQFSLLRLNAWFRKHPRKDELLHYII